MEEVHRMVQETLDWLNGKSSRTNPVYLSQNSEIGPRHPAWGLHVNAMENGHSDPTIHHVAADKFEENGDYEMANFHRWYADNHKNYGSRDFFDDRYDLHTNNLISHAYERRSKSHGGMEMKAIELHNQLNKSPYDHHAKASSDLKMDHVFKKKKI